MAPEIGIVDATQGSVSAMKALIGDDAWLGGLGVIAAAHGSPEYLREEIRRVRDATDRPFGVDVLFATIRAAGDEVEKHIENGRDRFIRAMSATGQLVLKENVTGPSSRRRA